MRTRDQCMYYRLIVEKGHWEMVYSIRTDVSLTSENLPGSTSLQVEEFTTVSTLSTFINIHTYKHQLMTPRLNKIQSRSTKYTQIYLLSYFLFFLILFIICLKGEYLLSDYFILTTTLWGIIYFNSHFTLDVKLLRLNKVKLLTHDRKDRKEIWVSVVREGRSRWVRNEEKGSRLNRDVKETRVTFDDATYLLSGFAGLLTSPTLSHDTLTGNLLFLILLVLHKKYVNECRDYN